MNICHGYALHAMLCPRQFLKTSTLSEKKPVGEDHVSGLCLYQRPEIILYKNRLLATEGYRRKWELTANENELTLIVCSSWDGTQCLINARKLPYHCATVIFNLSRLISQCVFLISIMSVLKIQSFGLMM